MSQSDHLPQGPGSKENWGTRIGVILAVAGSAVGLGNFLRFPGLAAQYEGGAFMVPYFIALFVLGLPLAWGEWAMGRYGGTRGYNSSPGIYRSIWRNRASPYFGVLGMLVPVVIYMYYVLIESWCLAYAWFYLSGAMAEVGEAARAAAPEGQMVAKQPYVDQLVEFIGAGANGSAFTGLGLLFLAFCFVLNFTLIYRGLTKGIEKFCLIAMPALILCAFLVLIRVLTLPGIESGLSFMWEPVAKVTHAAASDDGLMELVAVYDNDGVLPAEGAEPPEASIGAIAIAEGQWQVDAAEFTAAATTAGWEQQDGGTWHHEDSKLAISVAEGGQVVVAHRGFLHSLSNPKMWLDATGQIFFTLSVGFGIIITYSSYLRRRDDIALSSLSSAAGNEFCEVALGGMIIIPSAFIFLGAATVTSVAETGSSFNLGFMTLPMVFELMPQGYIVGFLFFFLLFLAAVTSSLSMLQPAIALMEEGLGLTRKASVAMLGFVTLCGAMFVLYFSANTLALDTMDTWVGTLCIYLLAMFQVFLFGWILGSKRGMEELDRGAEIRVPRIVGFMLKWVAPIYLLAIFIAFILQQISQGKDSYFAKAFVDPVAGMSVGFILLVALFFALIIAQAVKRWRKLELAQTETRI